MGHQGPITDFSILNLNHNNTNHINQIVTSSGDSTLKIWDFETTELLKTLKGHEGLVTSVQANQFRIISSGMDGFLRVWDQDEKKCRKSYDTRGPIYDVWMGDTVLICAENGGDIMVRCFLPE